MCRQRKEPTHNITTIESVFFVRVEQVGLKASESQNGTNSQIRAEQWGGQRGQTGQNGSNSLIRAEQWGGVRGVRGAKMDQNSLIRAEQWGVRGAKMDQIPKFVLNNGGVKGVRGPELRGPEKSGK